MEYIVHKTCFFKKSERLADKKSITSLFEFGKSIKNFPFKVLYQESNTKHQNQVLVSVAKRKYKKAVDRNRIKRLTKEAYRKNKYLGSSNNISYKIAFIYISDKILTYNKIEESIQKILIKLSQNEDIKK